MISPRVRSLSDLRPALDIKLLYHYIQGFLFYLCLRHRVKESTCQCRRCKRHRLDPWVGKIPWSRKWQATPVLLPGESHRQRSLMGYSPPGHIELDMTENTHTHSISPLYFINRHRHCCSWVTNTETHKTSVQFSSVTQSCPTLWPHGLQHTRPPCPSPTPRVY